MKNDETIVFFSSVFPYETTLDKEIENMSKHFDKIYYIPVTCTVTDFNSISFPNNVTLITDLCLSKFEFNVLDFFIAIRLFFLEAFKKGNLKSYLAHPRHYLYFARLALHQSRILKQVIEENKLQNSLFYDYWFVNATMALSLLKSKSVINKLVVRAHAFDLYDEKWSAGQVVPFRDFSMKFIDRVYTISNHGYQYLQNKTRKKYHEKIYLSYLGVRMLEWDESRQRESNLVLVSASHTQDFKRVHLIPTLLKKLTCPVRWIHYGVGPNDELIKNLVKELPENVRVSLMGYKKNSEIIEFYQNNVVDGFVSLSLKEGVPISMMEAISFGIPLFACNVHGIPDILNEDSGVAFEVDDNIEELNKKLQVFVAKKFDAHKIKCFAKERFDLDRNYDAFFTELKGIC